MNLLREQEKNVNKVYVCRVDQVLKTQYLMAFFGFISTGLRQHLRFISVGKEALRLGHISSLQQSAKMIQCNTDPLKPAKRQQNHNETNKNCYN